MGMNLHVTKMENGNWVNVDWSEFNLVGSPDLEFDLRLTQKYRTILAVSGVDFSEGIFTYFPEEITALYNQMIASSVRSWREDDWLNWHEFINLVKILKTSMDKGYTIHAG